MTRVTGETQVAGNSSPSVFQIIPNKELSKLQKLHGTTRGRPSHALGWSPAWVEAGLSAVSCLRKLLITWRHLGGPWSLWPIRSTACSSSPRPVFLAILRASADWASATGSQEGPETLSPYRTERDSSVLLGTAPAWVICGTPTLRRQDFWRGRPCLWSTLPSSIGNTDGCLIKY